MKLIVEDNNSMSRRTEMLRFDTLEEVETFIKKNSFDRRGTLILCEYVSCSLKIKDFPSGDVHALIKELSKSFGGDAARFSYTLVE
jgi:hypothetical protein